MENFDFLLKTKIYFGRNREDEVGSIVSSFGYKKVLIILGSGSARKSGLYDKVINSLDSENIDYMTLEGIRANPEIKLVRENIQYIKEYAPDLILAVGGGSVIDTAKSIAVSCYYEGDPFDFNLHKVKPENALPIGVVLTISAAGSEASTSCVMQDDEVEKKNGFNSELVRPIFAIENPELTYSVSPVQTAYGVVDILMHTIERYFSFSNECVADHLALALIKSTIDAGLIAYNNPTDYDSRAALMLNSSLSHCGITSIGKKYGMPVHQLEHALSGKYPWVAHAAGLAVLFPKWARYYLQYDIDKFDNFAKNIFDCNLANKYENALAGIECFEKYLEMLDMPKNYADLNIESVDIESLADILTNGGARIVGHHVKPMDRDVAIEIFNSCI